MLKTKNSGRMMVSSIREVEKTLRDGMRWEGGFRMGNTCTPVADSCRCMAKPIQYCN